MNNQWQNILFVLCIVCVVSHSNAAILDPNDKVIVGYWHNFSNGSSDLRLIDVPEEYNVINVSFIENKPGSQVEVFFTPYATVYPDENLFIADVAALKAQGRRVQISIGGQNGHIVLSSESDKNIFVAQTIAICEKYGFNGLDIDLEGASIGSVQSLDFTNPTNPQFLFFNQAVTEILNHFGDSFWLTAAPEIYYVQAAKGVYGGGAVGAYLPFLYHFRDRIDVLHVQLYNASAEWTEYGTLAQNSADFMVYMCDLLIKGFTVGNGTGKTFPGFAPSKIAIGKPSGAGAASSGISSLVDIAAALKYLITGESFGGAYPLENEHGYADFRGIMTWSINWDQTNGYAFANNAFKVMNNGNYVCSENCSSTEIEASSSAEQSSSSEIVSISSESMSSSENNVCVRKEYQAHPTIYQTGDRVHYNGSLFESLSDNLFNVIPAEENNHFWLLIGPYACDALSSAEVWISSSALSIIELSSQEPHTLSSENSTDNDASSSSDVLISSSEFIAPLVGSINVTHRGIQLFNRNSLQKLKIPESSSKLTIYEMNGTKVTTIIFRKEMELLSMNTAGLSLTLIAVFE